MGNQFFSTRVKELREKAGLTMDQLAQQIGVTKSRISMWENNGVIPRMNVLLELASFFNVTTDFLLGHDDTKHISAENSRLCSLQRNLGKLNESDLKKAEALLKTVFMDIFNDDDKDDNI